MPKFYIKRNLGAGFPPLVEGQVADVDRQTADRLRREAWLAEELPEPEPVKTTAPPEVKAVEPVSKSAGKNPVVSKPGK